MEKDKQEKNTLHPRNQHRSRYDFKALIETCPELAHFVALNKYGDESIDFSNPKAVKSLNKALLQHFYQVVWDIPEGYLCPPIPGRADYLHYAADLLASCNEETIPVGKKVKLLDIGVGANCIYPIIGKQTYGWDFAGSDIDEMAIRAAQNIVNINAPLKGAVDLRLQKAKNKVFDQIIRKEEHFDLTICNPPFHASAAEAAKASQRKVSNLAKHDAPKPVLNFGGQNNELWTAGGELAFVRQMIEESKLFKSQCFWFSSLISKSEHLDAIYAMLNYVGATDVRTSNMSTGNKITRIVAWTFLDPAQQKTWQEKYWKA